MHLISFFLLFGLVLPQHAQGTEKTVFRCINNMALFASTVTEKSDSYLVNVYYASTQDRPFHAGQITNRDLEEGSFLRKKQELMNRLPNSFNIEFAKKDCELAGDSVTCSQGKLLENSIDARYAHYTIRTVRTTLVEMGQSFEEKQQTVSFLVGSYVHSYRISYWTEYGDQCSERVS